VTQLLAFDTCAVVDEWRFTGVRRFGAPSCTATWCAIATAGRDHVSVWRLEHGREPIQLAQLARASSLPTPTPHVAISPDGRDIAIAIAEVPSPALYLVDSAGGQPRSLQWAGGVIDGMVWDPDGRLLISGQGIDDVPYALVSVAPDGTRQSIWSSKTTYLGLLATDPARTYLSGLVSTWQQEFLLLDPTMPVRSAAAR
jgi:Tol biopolymer transport system component